MNSTKEQYKINLEKGDNKGDFDYSSSSGVDSKRDSSDDNCSETNLNSSTIVSEQTIKMNGIKNSQSKESGHVDNKRKQTRFSVNNIDDDDGKKLRIINEFTWKN